jgi:predicted amidohydrolase YtcJ
MSTAPDLVVLGRIATLSGEVGFGWTEGLAILDGRIVAAGARQEIEDLAGAGTRIIELAPGQAALPAITDAHLHLVAAAVSADEVDLSGMPSLEAALEMVAEAHAARSRAGDRMGWLLGHGWTTDGWAARPTAADLERVAPGRPIALWAHDHHTRWLSAAALATLGIDATTPDPPGGSVERDADGRPDGLLYEHATRIGAAAIPPASEAAIRAALVRYADRLAALGGRRPVRRPAPDASLAGFSILRAMAAEGQLPLRVHAGIRDEQLEASIVAGLRSGDGVASDPDAGPLERRAAERYRVGWLKLFGDGSVGSRTAAMLEAYDDAWATRTGRALGSLLETRERLTERV